LHAFIIPCQQLAKILVSNENKRNVGRRHKLGQKFQKPPLMWKRGSQ